MKHPRTSSLLPVPVLAALIVLFALPDSVPALSGSGGIFRSTCVRLKAGHEAKSGACAMYISVTNEFDIDFEDEHEQKGDGASYAMSYECTPSRGDLPNEEADKLPDCMAQIFPLDGTDPTDRHCTEADVMPGEKCVFSMDGAPAVIPANPPKPAGTWFCLQKTGTDEIMCAERSDNLSP